VTEEPVTRYSEAMSVAEPSVQEILSRFDKSDGALRTEPRRALELALKAQQLSKHLPALRARALLKVSVCHFSLGEMGRCPVLLEECIGLCMQVGDHKTAFAAFTNLGVVSANGGDLARAITAYENALTAAQACQEDPGSLGVLNNLGAVHGRMGDLDAALACFENGLSMAEQTGNDLHLAYSLVNLAQALQQLNRLEDSRKAWDRAETLLGPEHPLHAHVLCGLGTARAQSGDLDGGLALINQAVRQAQATEHALDALSFRMERGLLGLAHARVDPARAELEEVLNEAIERAIPHIAIRTCEALAESLASTQDYAKAWGFSQTLRGLERRRVDAENAKALRQLTDRHQAEIHKLRNVELAAANIALEQHQIDLVQARDQAQEASRAKTAFLANLSHDVRTPLNGVMGLTEALLSGELDPEQRRILQTIRASGSLTLSILGAVLELSSIEAGGIKAKWQPWEPAEAVDNVLAILAPSAAEQGLRLLAIVEPDLPRQVLGDRTRVQQILLNLVQNGLKFTEHGHVEVRVSRVLNPDRLCLTIRDTGRGLPPGDPETLFEPFAQGPGERARARGTGLGLAICRRLARLMEGTLTGRNHAQGGSEFVLTLPLLLAEEQAPKTLGAPVGPIAARVLVAEDVPVSQEVARLLLSALGLEVHVVADGAQAVEQVAHQEWDLVFLDCEMPVMDGYTAARAIRATGSRIPLVALTANALLENVQACRAAGIDEVLTKPIQPGEVREVILRLVDRQAPESPVIP
jgi:signal transduction histidine kinase/ActR/RegA family two-component response regulator/exonuclease VII small subunit